MMAENGIGYATLRHVLWGGMWPGSDRCSTSFMVPPDSAGERLERGGIDGEILACEICFVPARAIPDGPKMRPPQTEDGM